MQYVRRHWYEGALIVAAVAIVVALVSGIGTLRMILLLNFAALLLHQFEEYGWPGGGPWILNDLMKHSDQPDRYPLNQNNAFFINVVFAWPFYLLAVCFPQTIWLGLGPVLFGFGQILLHGVICNLKLRSLYNPGVVTAICLHGTFGVWYLIEAYDQNAVSGWDWLFGILYAAGFAAIMMIKIGYGLLGSRNSPYPFAPEEMARFDHERRIARVRTA